MASTSQHDWSLHRKGPVDQARHGEKIKEAIKENLPDFTDLPPALPAGRAGAA